MINVGIVGSTGYGGCELVRFLLTHPNVNIEWVSSRTYSDQEYSDVYKSYFTLLDQKCVDEDIENEMANEFEDEKSTEDFDKKVNDVTPKPININNI